MLPPLFWAGNFVLGRALRADIPPLALSFWRWFLALLLLLALTHRGLRAHAPALRRHWRILWILALLGVTGYNTFAYVGLQHTTATNGVLLSSTTPVLILLLAWALLRERFTLPQGVGMLLSLAGVVVIVAEGNLARLLALTPNRGDLWILLASVDWALYSLYLRWRPADIEPLVLLTAIVALGCIPLSLLYGVDLAYGHRFAVSAPNLAALGYVAVFPSVLAYVIWNRAVAELGAGRTGQYMHLMPLFGAGLSMLLLGERPGWHHGLGLLLIAGGIRLAAGRERSGSRARPVR